jgi:hypothetical protein
MRRLSFAAAVLAFVAACESAVQPTPSDVFVLTRVDGQALPAARPNDPGFTILNETLVLDREGVATRTTTYRGATPSDPVTNSVSYRYTRTSDAITIGDVICGPLAYCAHDPEKGAIWADSLMLFALPLTSSSRSAWASVYHRATVVD